MAYIPLVLLVISVWPSSAVDDFSVMVGMDGLYQVIVDNRAWLYSGATSFQADGRHHSTDDHTLKMSKEPQYDKGADMFGDWKDVTYTWDVSGKSVQTIIKKYTHANVALFTQFFPDGLNHTTTGNKNGVISAFPAFVPDQRQVTLGVMAYGGLFIGWINMAFGRWSSDLRLTDGLDSGPLVLFDDKDHVLIISPFSQFMASSYSQDQQTGGVSWGLMGDVDTVPKGYTYSTVVFYGNQGVNQALQDWGAHLRQWYGRTTAARDIDPSIAYISYYTDNGAYYYHYTEPGMNYEKTLSVVMNGIEKQRIPYRSIQLDDWWYPVKGPGYGATITWTADPKVFPHGLQFVYNMTQLPVVAHNRYWSNTTLYAKQNGGLYNFIMDGIFSLPDDPTFWYDLLRVSKEWGLIVYEQDWLNYQVENIKSLHSDLSLGRRWLQQMGEAATILDLQIQYCMAQPRHLLASLEVPAVSQIRASIDYQLQDNQWQIGVTSMFADALGVAPFKDNFWTRTNQPHNVYNKTEPNPLLQAAVALLSTGPVGVSDRADNTDTDIVNRLINAEGLLLKPSKPATAINAQILQRSGAFGDVGPVGEVWSTYSRVSDIVHGIIFSPQLNKTYSLLPKDVGLPDTSYLVYSYKYNPQTDKPKPFSHKVYLTLSPCTLHDFNLYYASPVYTWRKQTLAVLGELSKLVPVSPQRVSRISYTSEDVRITLNGPPGERVVFYVYYISRTLRFDCVMGQDSTATISMYTNTCV